MRIAVPVICGVVGFAILMALGVWQVRRLAWKEGILSDIAARIDAPPQDIPADPEPGRDTYLPVRASGALGEEMLRVLISQKGIGAGYRIISPFVTGGRTVMLDRGVVPVDRSPPVGHDGIVDVVGNLHWPDETDGFTPDPDLGRNIWFSREVPKMAQALNADPVLIVLRERSFDDGPVMPLPVGAEGIPNDHLGYAITWFSLAIAWAGMTGFFVWRMRRPKTEG